MVKVSVETLPTTLNVPPLFDGVQDLDARPPNNID